MPVQSIQHPLDIQYKHEHEYKLARGYREEQASSIREFQGNSSKEIPRRQDISVEPELTKTQTYPIGFSIGGVHGAALSSAVIKLQRTIKVERLIRGALHPGPFANYKGGSVANSASSGGPRSRFLFFPAKTLCGSPASQPTTGSFSTETPYKITFFVQAKFVSLPMAPVDYKDRSLRRRLFCAVASSSYPRKSYLVLVPRYVSLFLSLSIFSFHRLLSVLSVSSFRELIGDGCSALD